MISKRLQKANPNCARTFASLRMYGDALDPVMATTLLQISPTDAAVKGYQPISPAGKTRTAPTGRWIFDTDAHVDSTDLEEHIDWLLDRVEGSGVSPTDIDGVSSADIFCYWVSATGQGGPQFSPELLARLAKHNLTLGLDIYFDQPAP